MRSPSANVRRSVVITAALLALASCDHRDPIHRLVKTTEHHRPIEARLTGGFPWAPLPAVRRGNETHDSEDLRVQVAAAEILRDYSSETSPAARQATAAAHLVRRDASRAIATLSPVAASSGDSKTWSDLAAAFYTKAVASNSAVDLVSALVAVDTALRIDAKLPEGRFNRALILERFGLRDSATRAWKEFLEIDSGSGWAVEARSRLDAISAPQESFREIFKRDYDRLASDPAAAADLARRFPQEARTWGETEVLGRWAEAERTGDRDAAASHLLFARSLASGLEQVNGDRMLARAVDAIGKADAPRKSLLASGHVDFRAGQRLYKTGQHREAETALRRAAAALEEGNSPVSYLARYFAANTTYDQGHMAEAKEQLENLLATVPPELPACRAQVQWQMGLCRAAESRWGECLTVFSESLKTFERLREHGHAATLRELLAEVHEMTGNAADAWEHRTAALRELGYTTTPFLQGVFGNLSQAAVLRRDWAVAASFLNLEIEAAETAKHDEDLADAYLRRVLTRHHLPDPTFAEDFDAARAVIARIPDAGVRARMEARRLATEGMTASSPRDALQALDAALAFHRGAGGQRMFIPSLLLYRARAHRALGDLAAARTDLDVAIGELEQQRESLPAGEQRWGVFDSAEAIFEEAVDLSMTMQQAKAAFAYAERARGRALLESMPGQSEPASIPPDTVLVEYVTLPKQLVILVADADGVRATAHPIARDELAGRLARFIGALNNGGGAAGRDEGRSIYRDLVAPVEAGIATKKTLVIVPDATLSAVPFAALVRTDGRYLVEQHAVVVAPSAAVYSRTLAAHGRRKSATHLLMVVNAREAGDLENLTRTEHEARAIAALYPNVTLLSDERATPASFAREARTAQVIHFAGHALTSDARPQDAALVLAGKGGRTNVGRLSAMKMDACSTVVLAACSTGRGTSRMEGTFSVARAFIAAGASSVVATLWPIDDAEAARFFPRLHSHLRSGMAPADALRETQLECIRTSRSPALWAAVQVTGS